VTAAARADHFRAIANHRDQAVEHHGRAAIEAARAAQAVIDRERAEYEAGERPINMGVDRAAAEAEAQAEREAAAEAEA
jgi:hypothetical protein